MEINKEKVDEMVRLDNIREHDFLDKYVGDINAYLKFNMSDTYFNILRMEKICIECGFRIVDDGSLGSPMKESEVYNDKELIAIITNSHSFPKIEFEEKHQKYAEYISKHEDIIEPIYGYQIQHYDVRSTIEGKLQKYDDEIILHVLPATFDYDKVEIYLKQAELYTSLL